MPPSLRVVAQREVGEEEVMVDDDDVALHRALVHGGDEAAVEIGALLPGAKIAARVDLGPRGAALGQRLDLGAVAEFGGLLPVRDDLEIGDLFEPGEHGVLVGVVDLLAARVVVAPLHVADLERPREVLLEERDVLEKKLLLKVLRAGGNDDPLAREQRRDQVRERLAGARARLDDQVALIGERRFDGFGHLDLSRPELVIRMPLGERAAAGEELSGACRTGLGGHRDPLNFNRAWHAE